jgi:hypothetical protein
MIENRSSKSYKEISQMKRARRERLKRILIPISLLCFFLCCKPKEPLIGVKIYEHEGDLAAMFAEWHSLGINTVFAGVPLASRTYFKELAHGQGISVFLIIPVFYSPEELKKDPSLYAITDKGEKAQEDWVEFVCPTREDFRKCRLQYVSALVRELDPDGISLDFIRYFVFWEMIGPDRTLDSMPDTCFDQSCVDAFEKESGIRIPKEISGLPEKAEWIKKNHRQEWAEWKCRVITSMVKSIADEARSVKPGIVINLHALPWREKDYGGARKIIAGQDLKAIAAHSNFISPMCYWHMLRREPPWVHAVIEEMYSITKSRLIPSIQVNNAYISDELSPGEFRDALEEATKPPSAGVIFWNWEAFEQEPVKKEVLRAFLKSRRPRVP